MEVGAALVGVVGAVGAVKAAASAGFSGRHEAAHDALVSQYDRVVSRYRSASESSHISFGDENEYEIRLSESRKALGGYEDSIKAYKDKSWFRPIAKMERRSEVRKKKREAREAARSLWDHVDCVSNGSSLCSTYTESGSPPNSALARDDISDWVDRVDEANTPEASENLIVGSKRKWTSCTSADAAVDEPNYPSKKLRETPQFRRIRCVEWSELREKDLFPWTEYVTCIREQVLFGLNEQGYLDISHLEGRPPVVDSSYGFVTLRRQKQSSLTTC
ncbi:hypothetical protein BDZ89DRAFT_1118106 [Hymenopellis radicata]|nr:hypothetical protein BDZ89DRAFT_1118106 [Hymenopellis radicata]